jgi:hypothetical protein
MSQQLLFELNGVRVAPHIATFRGTSYQIANIGSVRVVRRRKYNPFAIIIFLLGLGILAAAIVNPARRDCGAQSVHVGCGTERLPNNSPLETYSGHPLVQEEEHPRGF